MNIQRTDSRKLTIYLGILLVIVCGYFFLRLNLIDIPLNRDEGGFAYFGRLHSDGGILYKDFCDNKPPGIWFIYAAFNHLVPFDAKGIHWLLHFYNFITMLLLGVLAYKVFDESAAFWTMAVYAVASSDPFIEGFSASVEMFMLLPISASVLFCVLGKEKNSLGMLFVSGFLSAAAFWIKQPALVITCFMILFLICSGARKKSSIFIKNIIWFLTGFAVLSSVIFYYFYTKNLISEFIYWSFVHSLAYASHSSFINASYYLFMQLRDMFVSNPGLWVISISTIIFLVARKVKNRWLLIGFFISSFFSATHSTLMYRHYFALLYPAISLLSGAGCSFMTKGLFQTFKSRMALKCLAVGIIIVLPVSLNYKYYFVNSPDQTCRFLFPGSFFSESPSIARFIQELTGEDDKIMVMGSEPQIPLLANRKSATRHLYFYHVVGPYKRSEEFQQQVIDDINTNPPALIVVNNSIRSWAPEFTSSSRKFILNLKQFLHRHYKVEKIFLSEQQKGKEFVPADKDISKQPSISVWHKISSR